MIPEYLAYYISNYGCLAIFIFIFLQEVGAPNPIPNEFMLLLSGYLSASGILFYPLVVFVCASADILAAIILYSLFYYFGTLFLSRKPRWVPISSEKIEKQCQRIQNRGTSSIVVGRVSPFIRGYVAVICGILHVPPRKYAFIILITSALWAGFYITIGFFLAPYWNYVMTNLATFKYALIGLVSIIISIFVVKFIRRKIVERSNKLERKIKSGF